jgi:hypothetical protein
MNRSVVGIAGAVLAALLGLLPAAALGQCCGDCNGDGEVTVDELVRAVNRALGRCQEDGICSMGTCQSDLATCMASLSDTQESLTTCNANEAQCQGNRAICTASLTSTRATLAACDANLTQCRDDQTTCTASLASSETELATCTTNLTSSAAELATCTTEKATALACGNGNIDAGESCDQGNLNNQTCVTQGFVGGTLECGADCAFDTSGCYAARFVDNADGTITDNQSGLQWEKKVELDHTADLANLQDADNLYAWTGTCTVSTTKDCQPPAAAATACAAGVEGNPTGCAQCTGEDGTCSATDTVWSWLAALNTTAGGFGGHNDWRLAKRAELEEILDLTDATSPAVSVYFHGMNCGGSCADITSAACSCTQPSSYWSATTGAGFSSDAWLVSFSSGFVLSSNTSNPGYVRAVRGGL